MSAIPVVGTQKDPLTVIVGRGLRRLQLFAAGGWTPWLVEADLALVLRRQGRLVGLEVCGVSLVLPAELLDADT